MHPVFACYIPVLHEGYRKFFERHPNANELFLFDENAIAGFEHLVKDIRRLPIGLMKKSIEAWERFERVAILDQNAIEKLQKANTPLIISDDDISTELAKKYFSDNPIEADTIFLRWDKKKSIAPARISPDVEISEDAFDEKMMALAEAEGARAKDWWRRIGAIAVKDGKILFSAKNIYVPSDQIANAEGDPRGNFTSGEHLESSLALHSEAGIVAEAAKTGVSLNGADIYCTTFPCPPCAKQLAYAGIKRLYYRNGYAVLDGERILISRGVEIIFVK